MTRTDPRAILAENLRRMIQKSSPPGERPSVRAWALRKGLDVRMIDRMVKSQHAVTLDSLEKVAEACGLQVWQLLIEDFDASVHQEAPITEAERAMLRRLRHLLGDTP